MKKICFSCLSPWKGVALIGSITFLLAACGDDSKTSSGADNADIVAITDKTISGVSQKGPFVNGSSVTVQELDGETLSQTGGSFEGKIKNDMGEFSVKVKSLESQYALLKANGFYRNEVTGKKSKSQVTLYALTDLSNRDEVNVNLLTHLAYERSLYLAAEGLSVGKAKKQAESEILGTFGISGDFASAEDLSIFGTDDGAAALLAISVLMQGDLNEADFSERLANYAADIEEDGVWDDFVTATVIADWAATKSLAGELGSIRNNIAEWGFSDEVPAFEKYVDEYWWQIYSLGICDKKHKGDVKAASNVLSGNNGVYFICDDGDWRMATDIEKDTYGWNAGKDGKVKNGSVVETNCYVYEDSDWRAGNENDCSLGLRGCTKMRQDTVGKGSDEAWYICDNQKWRVATDIEKDTYGWKAGKDGKVKHGSVVEKNCYVYEDSVWRVGNESDCSLGLRGCTKMRQDTVGTGSDKEWYICDEQKWRKAADLEKDTYGWKAGKDGDAKNGTIVEKNCYVYEDSAWRTGNESDCSLGLRGCTKMRQDTVGTGSDKEWYICDEQKWRKATDIEKDTYGWKVGKDGDAKNGTVVEKNCYVYEDSAWRASNESDCSLGLRGCTKLRQNEAGKGSDGAGYRCESGEWHKGIYDDRDGQFYKMVIINDREWMAQNLNFDYSDNSFCYANDEKNCEKYGKLYNVSAISQKICPEGYHIPTDEDWLDLIGDWNISGKWGMGRSLKSKNAWPQDSAGTDEYGFNALPSGFWGQHKSEAYDFYELGHYAEFWSKSGEVIYLTVKDEIGFGGTGIQNARAVRCINNDASKPTIEESLGECVPAIADSIGKYSSVTRTFGKVEQYYICKPNNWELATELEYDTYNKKCTEFGQSVQGNVNVDYLYFCYGEEWKRIYGKESVTYEKLEDARDGQIYRTVEIENQLWMAENLNYAELGINGDSVGQSYAWNVIDRACPNGWHIPEKEEWEELLGYLNNDPAAMQAKGFYNWPDASDAAGFSAIPTSGPANIRDETCFWVGAIDNACLTLNTRSVELTTCISEEGCSVRCIKDKE